MKIIKGVYLFGTLLLSSASLAAGDYRLEQLISLFEQSPVQAYSYAAEHLAEQEGDPQFDYYYGVAAIDAGHASQGVFALERVLLLHPQEHAARLELARGYFILEEYARSRQEFETVMGANPPDDVVQNAQVFLDRIRLKEARYNTTSNGYIEIGAGTDNNVNSAPEQDATITGVLAQDSTGQEDDYSTLAASYQLIHPFAPGWTFNTALTGDFKKNADFDQFDTASGALQLGVSALDNQSKYSVDAVVQQFNLDGSKYRMLTGMTLGWRYSLNQKSAFSTSLQHAMLDFDTVSALNSTLTILNLSYNHQFAASLSPVLFASMKFGIEEPEISDSASMADVERDISGARLGVVLNLMQRLAMTASIATQSSDYGAPNTVTSVTREDTFSTADLNFLWLVSKDWRFSTKISYSKNDSNLAIRDYDRTRISINLNYAY
ncbi:MAG: DUF560 domain-containing protein [Aestuariibacter sp.]|nr:DUF560 domain-containing protein [Aestuariibacter sp.]